MRTETIEQEFSMKTSEIAFQRLSINYWAISEPNRPLKSGFLEKMGSAGFEPAISAL